MGPDPAEGPLVRFVAWAHDQSPKSLGILHIRDRHRADDPGRPATWPISAPTAFDDAYVVKFDNKSLTADPASLFVSYTPADFRAGDFRLKDSALPLVGTGRKPYANPGWVFHALPSAVSYDFHQVPRSNPPLIGATQGILATSSISAGRPGSPARPAFLDVSVRASAGRTDLVLASRADLPLVDVLILDARGRHVKSLFYGPMRKGRREVRLEGNDHQGRGIATGYYFARVSMGKDVLVEPVRFLSP